MSLPEPLVLNSPPRTRRALPFFLGICVLFCFWLVVIHQLGAQWSVYDQYHYAWSVPFLCLYLFWQRIRSAPASTPFSGSWPSPPAILWTMILVSLLYAPTRFFHEANPIWRMTSLLLALEVILLSLCFVSLIDGLPGLRRLIFPIAFFLVAVPWPSSLENFLVQSITRWNVAATIEFLDLLGIPALQHGNVIEIGKTVVGIDEACSGIRSFQATLMISLFMGELFFLRATRRVLLVLAGFVFSFLFNLARTSFLTWVGATKGRSAIAHWHDPAGATILLACFFSLWLLAWLLARNKRKSTPHPDTGLASGTENIVTVSSPRQAFPILAVGAIGAWLLLVELGTELWFRSHEKHAPAMSAWRLNSSVDVPGFTKLEIPHDVLDQFRADAAAQRLWQDPAGNSWQIYYFRWVPGHSLNKRIAVQLAKTHGPEKCLPAIGMALKSYLGIINVSVGNLNLAFQQYLFTAEGHPLHVFYGIYEDPSGSAVLANRRKDSASRVAAALAGSRNYGQRFLEIAISGPEQPLEAKAALARSLPTLIKVEN